MDVQDRIAFACVYLHDEKLPRFIDNIAKELYEDASLMGLFVTGFTRRPPVTSDIYKLKDLHRWGFDHLGKFRIFNVTTYNRGLNREKSK